MKKIAIMKKIAMIVIALTMAAVLFAGQASAASTYETKVTAGVNFRSEPSTSSKVYRLIPKGENVHVIEQVNKYWLKIEDKNGKIGYISADAKYTDYQPEKREVSAPAAKTAVAVNGVNFRSQPKVADNKIGFIGKGSKVELLEVVNANWLKIRYNGKVGYASANYFEYSAPAKPAPNAAADKIIATAMSYLGRIDYKFGANPWENNFTFTDCSGFVKLVFERIHGYALPRSSKQQATAGTYVAKSNLKPGDLVFFDTTGDGVINHVGIYIGNGEFIHAAPSNKVGINNLDTGYWKNHYVTARRILK
jgi:cell wall-associated NlpC family hydrolase